MYCSPPHAPASPFFILLIKVISFSSRVSLWKWDKNALVFWTQNGFFPLRLLTGINSTETNTHVLFTKISSFNIVLFWDLLILTLFSIVDSFIFSFPTKWISWSYGFFFLVPVVLPVKEYCSDHPAFDRHTLFQEKGTSPLRPCCGERQEDTTQPH